MKLKTFENMFSTEGHKGRLSFLIIQVCMIVVTIANVSFFSVLAEINAWLMLISAAIGIVQLWIAIVSYVHRIHDIGISTGWIVLIALPYINILFLFIYCFEQGTRGLLAATTLPLKTPSDQTAIGRSLHHSKSED